MTDFVDCAVIGAGVVGLAAARALAQVGHDVVILEAGSAFGGGISARNSEVVHAGMYYPPGSWKARLCVDGSRRLLAHLAQRGLPHRVVGKLIVATSEEEEALLAALLAKGRDNGCEGLALLSGAEARRLEPELAASAALHSPATAILDAHALMTSLLADAEAAGARLVTRTPVLGGEVTGDGLLLDLGGADPCRIGARRVVNAAGLGAQGLASAIKGLARASIPDLHFCKGNYFALGGRMPFSRLVYPMPAKSGLGIHFTLDLAGQGRFGPDTEWVEAPSSYAIDPGRKEAFAHAIRRYLPALDADRLRPAYAGIRPKLHPEGGPAADFVIDTAARHGVGGLVNLFGIESPGLTACLAIADTVTEALS